MKGKGSESTPSGGVKGLLLNGGIVVLVLTAIVLSYSLIVRTTVRPPVDPTKHDRESAEIIQIDVLNGCGISGVAGEFTSYLRSRGYDVVEIGNYRTFDVAESMVIDRTGNLETARKVAYALGIREANVIQQINHDYFLDATVVIGNDFEKLRPMR
jgi:hypothetical protein